MPDSRSPDRSGLLAWDAGVAQRNWTSAPSRREVLTLAVVAMLVFVAVLLAFDGLMRRVAVFGDSSVYAGVASAILQWRPETTTPQHFWGLPYVVAGTAVLTRTSPLVALVIVSIASSLIAIALIHRLYGGLTAALLVVSSVEWLQRSILGGAEPLFMALVVGAFVAARSRRWALAAFLGAYGTTVRPQGVFVLVGLAVALLAERDVRQLAVVTIIALVVGLLYVVPFQVYFGDPLAHFHVYQGKDWHSDSPVSIPFVAQARAMFTLPVPWTAIAREVVWILICAAGAVAMIRRTRFRRFAAMHKAESTFAALFLLFVFSYNSYWSLLEFARYALPVVPLVFFAFDGVVRIDRRILWAAAPVTALLSAVSALNVRTVLDALR